MLTNLSALLSFIQFGQDSRLLLQLMSLVYLVLIETKTDGEGVPEI